MNRNSLLVQYLVGLELFAGGVKDKVCDILSCFGITCSSSSVNNIAKYWSEKRKAIKDIDMTKFIRISFDNLNFQRKFAKTFSQGGGQAGERMLNLITSQVSHRMDSTKHNTGPIPSRESITEEDFFLQPDSPEGNTWAFFIMKMVETTISRIQSAPHFVKTYVQELETKLPSFTPRTADNVVYTRIDSLQASNIEDVSKFLCKLKSDLHIGEPLYPEKVVVCGDQQTFEWILPMSGDWHLMKLAAETIRDMLWESGLHDLAKLCSHHKDINQWRDVHRMLLCLHECLMNELVQKWKEQNPDIEFEKFIEQLCMDDNEDEVK